MSVKKAQAIANELEEELGFYLASYQNCDLEYLKSKLDEFLDLEVDTEELEDSEELSSDDGFNEEEAEEDF